MPCIPGEFEFFQEAESRTLHHLRTECCGSVLNRWGVPVELREPHIFGKLTDSPETYRYECRVACKCGKTAVVVYGNMERAMGIGCTLSEDT